MANQCDAKVFEVVGRQTGQEFDVDSIFAKCRLVLFETECSQPVHDVQCRPHPAVGGAWLRQFGLSRRKRPALPPESSLKSRLRRRTRRDT
jgi:hypothetical protein